MSRSMPFGFKYVETNVSTEKIPIEHWVVRVSTTPPEALESLREYERQSFDDSGEHSIEFLED